MAHARLSASSAHRWLNCAGSVNLSQGKDSKSAAAAQGTFAHEIAAACLNDPSVSPSDWLCKRKTVDGFEVECDLEMVEMVGAYVDAIRDDMQDGDLTWVEMALLEPLKAVDPDLGGTADHVRYRPSTKSLKVTDLKYGSGVFVDADDNPQLKNYALGTMLQVDLPVEDVEVAIFQPRFEGAAPSRSWKFKAYEILDFVADVQDAAAKSRQKDAPLVAGDWCKFCPAARECPELEKKRHAILIAKFGAEVYDPKALASALASVSLVKEQIKAIEEFAYAEATAGRFGPEHGFKLVDKLARRNWKSEGEVILWAQERAIDPYAPREVISPAQMEAKLKLTAPRRKKKEAVEVLKPFIESKSSGTVLVPVSDDRPPAKRISVDDFAMIGGIANKE